MGNSAMKGPKTDKITRDGITSSLTFGTCEMQGWRNNMVSFDKFRKILLLYQPIWIIIVQYLVY
jgi:hypothetical protein